METIRIKTLGLALMDPNQIKKTRLAGIMVLGKVAEMLEELLLI